MRKNKLLLGLVFIAASLSSCGKANDGFNSVIYDLNYPESTLEETIVKEGQTLKEPKPPFRKDFCFGGWYLDSECTVKFDGFNKALETDSRLYAKRTPFADLNPFEKASYFLNTIKAFEGNVASTFRESTLIYNQTITGSGQPMVMYQEDAFERYKDLTSQKTYAQVDETSEKTSLVATTQFQNDDKKIYQIIKDELNPSKSYKVEAKYDKEKHENYYNIGLTNLNLGDLTKFVALEGNTKMQVQEPNMEGLNITGFDFKNILKFSFSYVTTVASEEIGLLTSQYIYEGEITFVKKSIKRSNIRSLVAIGIGQELLTQEETINLCEYTTAPEFKNFEGEKFDQTQFPLKKENQA